MIILLPPSEGKRDDTEITRSAALTPALLADAKKVLTHLRRLRAAERPKFYGIRDPKKCAAAHKLTTAAPDAPCIPALERYTGVVYQFLDYASLSRKKDAEKRIHTVSTLWGLVAGGDAIPDYKLSMNPWLAKYWKPINAGRLSTAAEGKPVLNLLSQTYAKAIESDGLITVDFKLQGGKKSAGHFGKAIKGRFVRYLIENRITSPRDFDGFTEDGYKFDGTNFIQRG